MITKIKAKYGYFPFEPLHGQKVFLLDIYTDKNLRGPKDENELGLELYNLVTESVKKQKLEEAWDEALLGHIRVIFHSNYIMDENNKSDFEALYYIMNKTSWETQGGKLTPTTKAMELGYLGTPTVMTITAGEESWYEHFNLNMIYVKGEKPSLTLMEALNSRFAYAISIVETPEEAKEFVEFFEGMQNVQPKDRYIAETEHCLNATVKVMYDAGLRVACLLPHLADLVIGIDPDFNEM